SNVRVTEADVLGPVGGGFEIIERVVEAGIAATAAEAVGAMEAMNEMTLEYSKTRVQFGQPIGSYQVVQHRLADMFMTQEQGRSMAMLATMSLENPDAAERARNLAMAKVGVGQSARYVSQSAVQMHGGIGMTEEYAVGHYFRRCMVIERLWGDPAYWLQKLADQVE
ncbi:MAG: pimeloyl-CoA dehydrogenase small subunit, partial [Rhodospirillales bacterium]|nr:pimeloyl-CoA dehydrogenase small subunit [Rhodospirillales bacterium]